MTPPKAVAASNHIRPAPRGTTTVARPLTKSPQKQHNGKTQT